MNTQLKNFRTTHTTLKILNHCAVTHNHCATTTQPPHNLSRNHAPLERFSKIGAQKKSWENIDLLTKNQDLMRIHFFVRLTYELLTSKIYNKKRFSKLSTSKLSTVFIFFYNTKSWWSLNKTKESAIFVLSYCHQLSLIYS